MPGQRKRVLLMVSSMRGGGSERQVLMLAKALDRSRFIPHLYLTEATGDFLDQVPADVVIHSFDTCPDAGGVYLPGRQLRRQTNFLSGVIRDHQIDVVYDRTFHMTLLAGKAAQGVRRVSTIVSPPHLALPLVEKRFVALKRRRLAAAYRSSDVVIAVSDQAAKSAEAYYGLGSGSILIAKNPVDVDQLNQFAKQAVGQVAKHPTRTQLVCVGRMTPEKGHADLIDAIALVHQQWPESRGQLAVRFVGDGPLRGALESRVTELGLAKCVNFLGSMKCAIGEIAAADALVLPSRFEGMPNVVLEAMALATPVIATRSGGTVELERETPTIFWAQPNDAASLGDAILRFAGDPGKAKLHCNAARRLIESEHDAKSIVRKIEDLLAPDDSLRQGEG